MPDAWAAIEPELDSWLLNYFLLRNDEKANDEKANDDEMTVELPVLTRLFTVDYSLTIQSACLLNIFHKVRAVNKH